MNFVKCFSCIYWDDHIIFILQLANVVYHTDWVASTELSSHPWGKSHLMMVYDYFDMLFNLVWYYFVENFCIYIHQWYWCQKAWTLMPNRILETKFWWSRKRISLLLCQAKGETVDFCPQKLCVLTQANLVRDFRSMVQWWGCW